MGYPLRNRDPAASFLVTIRTEEQRFFMRPCKLVNQIIGGVIARYQEIFGIELYAYAFMSNHYHLLLSAPRANLDEFMENVNREIARRINYKLHRRGRVWSKRYRAQLILNDEDLLQAFLYVTTNPVKHGAARHPAAWIGLCSYRQSIHEKPLSFPFILYSEKEVHKKITRSSLTISPLPFLSSLSKVERSAFVHGELRKRVQQLVRDRRAKNQSFLTSQQSSSIDPLSAPKSSRFSPTGNCYSKCPEVIRAFKRNERLRCLTYSFASMRFRWGDFSIAFPEFTFKPPLHRKPRIRRFEPLPDDYFSLATTAT